MRYVTIATTAPVTSGGIKGSGASDNKSNSDSSQPDVNSSRAGNNGKVRKINNYDRNIWESTFSNVWVVIMFTGYTAKR